MLQGGSSSVLAPGYAAAIAAEESALLQAAKAGGMYYIKVTDDGSSDPGVLASIPAHCWATAGGAARIVVHVLDKSQPVAASLAAPCDVAALQTTPSKATLPSVQSVQVVRPETAPELQVQMLTAAQLQQQQAAAKAAEAAAVGGDKEEGEKGARGGKIAPEKDERTWLQKNWMFLALVAFMMANRLGGTGGGAGQAGQPGAQATGRRTIQVQPR